MIFSFDVVLKSLLSFYKKARGRSGLTPKDPGRVNIIASAGILPLIINSHEKLRFSP